MIEHLNEAILKHLPKLLENPALWDSLLINRRKPFTYRVFTTLENGMRICLHKFNACDTHEAFAHPHPWPGAFIVLKGGYKMIFSHSCNGREDVEPKNISTLILRKHSMYEITDPLVWHSVIPLKDTYTIMINAVPWEPEVAHISVRTTKGKDLDKMSDLELVEHLNIFKELVSEYLYSCD